jgi:hypothetical protein
MEAVLDGAAFGAATEVTAETLGLLPLRPLLPPTIARDSAIAVTDSSPPRLIADFLHKAPP